MCHLLQTAACLAVALSVFYALRKKEKKKKKTDMLGNMLVHCLAKRLLRRLTGNVKLQLPNLSFRLFIRIRV